MHLADFCRFTSTVAGKNIQLDREVFIGTHSQAYPLYSIKTQSPN